MECLFGACNIDKQLVNLNWYTRITEVLEKERKERKTQQQTVQETGLQQNIESEETLVDTGEAIDLPKSRLNELKQLTSSCLFDEKKISKKISKKHLTDKLANIISFICLNDKCPNKCVVMSRDKLSALAIGLAGVAQLLFGVTFPCFDHKPTKEKELEINKLALAFCKEIACRLALR